MSDGPYINDDGWSVDCTLVQAGSKSDVWSLVVQMDEDRINKQSQIFYTPDSDNQDSSVIGQTQTWISSFWVSPSGTIYACDGPRLWTARPGGALEPESGLADRAMLKVWGLDDHRMFILGEDGLALRKDGTNWQDISLPDGRRLVDITATPAGEVFACGHTGAFCRLEGAAWLSIDLGTDVNIRGVRAMKDGSVIGCGERGTAFRYSDGQVEFFKAEPDRYFGGAAEFMGKVFFGASGDGVEVLNGDEIVPFKPNVYGQRLSANESYLWSCGGNSIFRYDGKGWIAEDFV